MAAPERTSRVIVSVVNEPGSGFADPDRRVLSLDSLMACLISTRGIRVRGLRRFCLDSKLRHSTFVEPHSIFKASGWHIRIQWIPEGVLSFWLWNQELWVPWGCGREPKPVHTVCNPLDSRPGWRARKLESSGFEIGNGGFGSGWSGFEIGKEASGGRNQWIPVRKPVGVNTDMKASETVQNLPVDEIKVALLTASGSFWTMAPLHP